jgi:hypothetical protein
MGKHSVANAQKIATYMITIAVIMIIGTITLSKSLIFV